MPELQYPIYDEHGDFVARPDFVWPREKVVVEGHSKLWHEGLVAKQSDEKRHRRLCGVGCRVLYVTWADATTFADAALDQMRQLLEDRSDVEEPRWDVVQLAENG